MAYRARNYLPLIVRGDVRDTQYAEDAVDTQQFSWDGKRGACSIRHVMKWDRTHTAVKQMWKDYLGYSFKAPAKAGKIYISRIIPWEHPNYLRQLYADSIQKGKGDVPAAQRGDSRDAAGAMQYDELWLDVVMSTRNYAILDDAELEAAANTTYPDESKLLRYVDVQVTPASRMERIPSGVTFRWVGSPLTPAGAQVNAQNIGVMQVVEFDVHITHFQIPLQAIPWVAMDRCYGKTNSDALGADSSTFPYFNAETMIYGGGKITPAYPMPDGSFAVDILHAFKWKPYGANAFMRWDATTDITGAAVTGPTWQLLTRTGFAGGTGPFPKVKFNPLFWGPDQ